MSESTGNAPDDADLQDSDPEDAAHVALVMRILELVSYRPGLSVPEIADQVDAHARTVRRYLARLTTEGYLMRHGSPRRPINSPTFRLVALAGLSLQGHPLITAAQPLVRLLYEETRAPVHLVVPSYGATLCVLHAESSSIRGDGPRLRETMPAHATAGGKALLANRPEWFRSLIEDEAGPAPLRRWTHRTITDPTALREELDTVHETGVAWEREEHLPGAYAVAVPIRLREQVPAALSVSGDGVRLRRALAPLKQTALLLQEELLTA